jgi:hypothetical protein
MTSRGPISVLGALAVLGAVVVLTTAPHVPAAP